MCKEASLVDVVDVNTEIKSVSRWVTDLQPQRIKDRFQFKLTRVQGGPCVARSTSLDVALVTALAMAFETRK